MQLTPAAKLGNLPRLRLNDARYPLRIGEVDPVEYWAAAIEGLSCGHLAASMLAGKDRS